MILLIKLCDMQPVIYSNLLKAAKCLLKRYLIFIVVLLSFVLNVATAVCSETSGRWNEAGVRMGIQTGTKYEFFHLYEAFAVYELPYQWRPSSEWLITTQLNPSLGALHTEAETAVIGAIGTGLKLKKTGLNLVPEAGISIDLMNKRYFGKQDFGSPLLFGAYIGLSYNFDYGFGIGYRLQHLSNGHIFYHKGTPNPGVDMHMITTSWNF